MEELIHVLDLTMVDVYKHDNEDGLVEVEYAVVLTKF